MGAPTLGRADGHASDPTMNRASDAGKAPILGRLRDATEELQRQEHQVPAGPLRSIGPTAEVMERGGSRASSSVKSASVDTIGSLRDRRVPSWVPSVTGGGAWT
jgi:hypothetical protein